MLEHIITHLLATGLIWTTTSNITDTTGMLIQITAAQAMHMGTIQIKHY